MNITLEEGDLGTFLIRADDTRGMLIQSDWSYAGIAATFGWVPCPCGQTDGTIDCKHKTAARMIAEAREFLQSRFGETVVDPGYF